MSKYLLLEKFLARTQHMGFLSTGALSVGGASWSPDVRLLQDLVCWATYPLTYLVSSRLGSPVAAALRPRIHTFKLPTKADNKYIPRALSLFKDNFWVIRILYFLFLINACQSDYNYMSYSDVSGCDVPTSFAQSTKIILLLLINLNAHNGFCNFKFLMRRARKVGSYNCALCQAKI